MTERVQHSASRRYRSPFVAALAWAVCALLATAAVGKVIASAAGERTVIRLELDPSLAGLAAIHWRQWIETTADSVAAIVGGFPQRHIVVQLEADRSRQPIAYGRVQRGNPPRIRLQVHPDASMAELLDDWRGYHEFAHLLIPFPGNDDIWFSEGLASYYQYLLQSRAGVIPPDEAWRRLAAGFRRGLSDFNGHGQTLRALSPNMWRERAFRRVYWTGAAYFLRVDLRLREQSGGKHSLDQVLADFHACCYSRHHRWNAERLIARFGELSIPSVWREEYESMIDEPAKPRVTAAFERLGIVMHADDIELGDAHSERQLRQALAEGTPGPSQKRQSERR
ncbi:MAG: hypothetical protein HND55_10500 [Pseudomonadota bacterium]|nr:MAG: hypothetical protein HND55_10500 [Pseudomonadota bacterium]